MDSEESVDCDLERESGCIGFDPESTQVKDVTELLFHDDQDIPKSLTENARKKRLRLYGVPKDADCLFNAVKDQLFNLENQTVEATELRASAVQYLRDHPPQVDLQQIPFETWEKYLENMALPGTFGDRLVIQALSEELRCRFVIVGTTSDLLTIEPEVALAAAIPTLYLGHVPPSHYLSLRPQSLGSVNQLESAPVVTARPAPLTVDDSLDTDQLVPEETSPSVQANLMVGDGCNQTVNVANKAQKFTTVINVQIGSGNKQQLNLMTTFEVADVKAMDETTTSAIEKKIVIKLEKLDLEDESERRSYAEGVEEPLIRNVKTGSARADVERLLAKHGVVLEDINKGCIEMVMTAKDNQSLQAFVEGFSRGEFAEVLQAMFGSIDVDDAISTCGNTIHLSAKLSVRREKSRARNSAEEPMAKVSRLELDSGVRSPSSETMPGTKDSEKRERHTIRIVHKAVGEAMLKGSFGIEVKLRTLSEKQLEDSIKSGDFVAEFLQCALNGLSLADRETETKKLSALAEKLYQRASQIEFNQHLQSYIRFVNSHVATHGNECLLTGSVSEGTCLRYDEGEGGDVDFLLVLDGIRLHPEAFERCSHSRDLHVIIFWYHAIVMPGSRLPLMVEKEKERALSRFNRIYNLVMSPYSPTTSSHKETASGPEVCEDSEPRFRSTVSNDMVPALRLRSWPEAASTWSTRVRHWPSQDVILDILKNAYPLVIPMCRTNHDDLGRISFSVPESRLAQSMTKVQKKSYLLVKAVLSLHMLKVDGFTSYHLKTSMFWYMEQTPSGAWSESNLFDVVIQYLQHLERCLEKGSLPNYFVTDVNLFDQLSDGKRKKLIESLNVAKEDLIRYVEQFLDETSADDKQTGETESLFVAFMERLSHTDTSEVLSRTDWELLGLELREIADEFKLAYEQRRAASKMSMMSGTRALLRMLERQSQEHTSSSLSRTDLEQRVSSGRKLADEYEQRRRTAKVLDTPGTRSLLRMLEVFDVLLIYVQEAKEASIKKGKMLKEDVYTRCARYLRFLFR